MDYAELDLAITRAVSGRDYVASARLRRPDGAEQDLLGAPLARFAPDPDALLALALDPAAYGAELGRALFADERLRQGLAAARAAEGDGLRIRLRLDYDDDALHALRWETLADPEGGPPLATSERAVLSRHLEGERLAPLQRRPRGALRALLAVAGPSGLERYRLAPVDVPGELGRARAALGADVRVEALAGAEGRPCTLDSLLAALREGPDILYLVCHGTNRQGLPILWLEDEQGGLDRVDGAALAERIGALPRPPTLVVLASCQSLGAGDEQRTLAAVGPRLAGAGVAAVIAMQGNISQSTVAALMPVFFRELQRDGRIDRALAAARAAVADQPDWWQPALFLRPRDGLIWGARTPPPAPAASLADALARRNRERMLRKVRSFWVEGVLERSLHGSSLIDLGLVSRPAALSYPWEPTQEGPAVSGQAIPPDQDIVDVFDALAGELLILGGAGAGKTTMLLDLARSLLARAEADPALPIPVVFNLSTWGEGRRPLGEWMGRELELRYDVPRKVAAGWVAAGAVLPLLDGLDEVAEPQRRACVEAIGAYRAEHQLYGVAVCARTDAYAAIGMELGLAGAVEIQPLDDAQIEAFLAGAGEQLEALRGALRDDAGLRDLATTPVMLSAMALAYRGLRPEQLPQLDTLAERRAHLFESYLRRMHERRPGRHTLGQTLGWLGWLARAMQQRSQAIFHIERLQPRWLEDPGELRAYTLIDRVGSGLLAALSILIWVPLSSSSNEAIISAVVEAITIGLIVALYGPRPAASRAALGSLARGGIVALIVGLAVAGLNALLGLGIAVEVLVIVPVLAGVFGALAALAGNTAGIGPRPVRLTEALAWRWARAWRAGLRGAAIGAGAGLAVGLALILLDATGLSPIFQSPGPGGEPAPGADELITIYLRALSLPPLIFVAALAPPWALLGGLVGDSVPERSRPNEGIRRSARSALIGGGLAMLLFAIVFLLLFLDEIGSPNVLIGALVLGIFAALPVALGYGGYACLSHLALRLILWRRGRIPWRLAAFLDGATEQISLRRVGGGYIFVHRLLMEHLAQRGAGAAGAPGEPVAPKPAYAGAPARRL